MWMCSSALWTYSVTGQRARMLLDISLVVSSWWQLPFDCCCTCMAKLLVPTFSHQSGVQVKKDCGIICLMVFIYLFLFLVFCDTGSYYVVLAALELNSASQVLGIKTCPVITQLFYFWAGSLSGPNWPVIPCMTHSLVWHARLCAHLGF